jgi:hypothetical protein
LAGPLESERGGAVRAAVNPARTEAAYRLPEEGAPLTSNFLNKAGWSLWLGQADYILNPHDMAKACRKWAVVPKK